MFRKSRSKSSLNLGSKESLNSRASSSNQSYSSSSENLSNSREMLLDSSSNALNRATPFPVHYLGMVQNFHSVVSSKISASTQLVDKVEEAQIEGKLQLVPKEEDSVTLMVSKHGIRVSKKEEVLQRHPLHTIAQMLNYNDGFGRYNIAIKIGQIGKNTFNCYVFQCQNEDQSQKICMSLQNIFQSLMQRGQ